MDLAKRKLELLQLQAEYRAEVHNLSRLEHGEPRKDVGEKGEFEQSEVARLRTLNVASGHLCGVDRALKLMGEGWKGACVDCAEEISDARIQAISWATRCTVCAEKRTPQPVIRHTRHGREVQGLGVVAS